LSRLPPDSGPRRRPLFGQEHEAVPGLMLEALQLSLLVFDGADVEIHMCDDQLKTLPVVIPFNKS
jgi:hypothetical protein